MTFKSLAIDLSLSLSLSIYIYIYIYIYIMHRSFDNANFLFQVYFKQSILCLFRQLNRKVVCILMVIHRYSTNLYITAFGRSVKRLHFSPTRVQKTCNGVNYFSSFAEIAPIINKSFHLFMMQIQLNMSTMQTNCVIMKLSEYQNVVEYIHTIGFKPGCIQEIAKCFPS